MISAQLSPARLTEIEKLAMSPDQRSALSRKEWDEYAVACIAAIPELIAEVHRLQSVVDRLANNERDLAETQLVLEQQDLDLERLRAELVQAQVVAIEHIAARKVDVPALIDENECLHECITALESDLVRARTYSPFSTEPCPLCTYEDGRHTVPCAMHRRIDEQSATIERLAKERDIARIEATETEDQRNVYRDRSQQLASRVVGLEADVERLTETARTAGENWMSACRQRDEARAERETDLARWRARNAEQAAGSAARRDQLNARIAALEIGLRDALRLVKRASPSGDRCEEYKRLSAIADGQT